MSRLLCLKAADMMDKAGNKAAAAEIAMIKVYAPNMALRIIDDAVQAHGGAGVPQDFELAKSGRHPHPPPRRRPRLGPQPRHRPDRVLQACGLSLRRSSHGTGGGAPPPKAVVEGSARPRRLGTHPSTALRAVPLPSRGRSSIMKAAILRAPGTPLTIEQVLPHAPPARARRPARSGPRRRADGKRAGRAQKVALEFFMFSPVGLGPPRRIFRARHLR